MPRVDFTPENKVATVNYEYPKLKLKKGEHARILIGLENPTMEFVHTLQKPQIVAGVPQMVTAKRRNDDEYQTNALDFVSRAICLGDLETLKDKGADPKNCPMCKLAKEHPDMTKEAKPRYAMHVIRYRTKSGGTELANPFSVDCLVWSFTGTIFNQLADMTSEWGDMRKHDLLLGPCTVEDYQKFDINVAAKAAWLETPERQRLVKETFADNQIPDLTIAVGAVKQRQWVEQDIALIQEAWAQVNGASVAAGDTNLDSALDDLLAPFSDSKKATYDSSLTKPGVDVEDTTPEEEAEVDSTVPDVDNFDELLADL